MDYKTTVCIKIEQTNEFPSVPSSMESAAEEVAEPAKQYEEIFVKGGPESAAAEEAESATQYEEIYDKEVPKSGILEDCSPCDPLQLKKEELTAEEERELAWCDEIDIKEEPESTVEEETELAWCDERDIKEEPEVASKRCAPDSTRIPKFFKIFLQVV